MRKVYICLSCVFAALIVTMALVLVQAQAADVRSNQALTNGGWRDDFDSPSLDSRWYWVREDSTHWSLTENPGYLRITTQPGGIRDTGNDGRNILLTPVDQPDFLISAKMTFSPTENFHRGGMVIYQDDDNYVSLVRIIVNGNQSIRVHSEIDGELFNISLTEPATTVYCRITKFGDLYIGEYSLDGDAWTKIGQLHASLENLQVGLMAFNGPSTLELPADFDFFELSDVEQPLYVAPGAECNDMTPCYGTIQEAVDTAAPFDLVKVAAGTYTDLNPRASDYFAPTGFVTQVVYIDKNVSIQGGYSLQDWSMPRPDLNPTILDAGGQGRVLYIIGDIYPRIKGLEITGGDAAGLGGNPWFDDLGGGVFVVTATARLEDNQIYGNSASSGGGLLCIGGGWGFRGESAPIISGNFIFSNTAIYGGGMDLSFCAATLVGNTIRDNEAEQGGGLSMFLSDASISGNLIQNNRADLGGGMKMTGDMHPLLVNNVFMGNQALHRGNALDMEGAQITLMHNTFSNAGASTGEGIYVTLWDVPEQIKSNLMMTNTILSGYEVGIEVTEGNTVSMDSVLWHQTPVTISHQTSAIVSVQNEYSGDPAFAADGYHLTSESAALDRGIDAGITVDIDGQARPAGMGYDLGADELSYPIYLPMVSN